MSKKLWTKKKIEYKAAPYGYITTIPAFTPVTPATNLPQKGYWVEPWANMDEKAEGWERGYGFHVTDEEVERIPRLRTLNMLDLSTRHITRKDADELERLAMEYRREMSDGSRIQPVPFRVLDHGYGFVIFVRHDMAELMDECENQRFEFSDHFWRIMKTAEINDSMIINLDTDGDTHKDLPDVYDSSGE